MTKYAVGENAFDDPIDAIVWKAYVEPKFFEELFAKKDDENQLKEFVKSFDLSSDQMRKLTESLKRGFVKIKPEELMKFLHTYTIPKAKIQSKWVEW